MIEAVAGKLRDLFLILALLLFAFGVLDVVMLAFDFSFKTGIMLKMGLKPHSIIEAATFLILTSIAFGVVSLNRSAK